MSTLYLQRIREAWTRTIFIAKNSYATPAQLEILNYLASHEFGEGSGQRLLHFWQTIIDDNREIQLCFYQTIDGEKIFNSQHVRVIITREGSLSTKNIKTGEEIFCNAAYQNNFHWHIDRHLIKPFLHYGVKSFANSGQSEFWCYISDLDITVRPFYPNCRFLFFAKTKNFEKCGICKLAPKHLAVFTNWYKDPITGEEVVKLYDIPFVNRAKLKLSSISWKIKCTIKNMLQAVGYKNLDWTPKLPVLHVSSHEKDIIGYASLKT